MRSLAGRFSTLGAPPAAFDRFEPWFVAMSMTAVAAQQLRHQHRQRTRDGADHARRRARGTYRSRRARGDRVAAPPVRRHARGDAAHGSCASRSTNSTRSARRWRRCSPPGRGRCRATAADHDADRATRPGPASTALITDRNRTWARLDPASGWHAPAPSSSRSVPAIWPAATASRSLLRARGLRAERVPHVETAAPPS